MTSSHYIFLLKSSTKQKKREKIRRRFLSIKLTKSMYCELLFIYNFLIVMYFHLSFAVIYFCVLNIILNSRTINPI